MKVLVTGANGQVGRALLASAPVDWHVAGLTRDDCDLADQEEIRATIASRRPDLLINAAAYTAVDRAESEPELAQAVNADAVAVMAGALAESGGKLLQLSTDFVFDGTRTTPYPPDATRKPLSAYGRSKTAGEDAAGPEALVLRTAWLYAAGSTNFVATMLHLMRTREELSVVSDQIGTPTWVGGLAPAIWQLAARGLRGAWHYCDGGACSWHAFAIAIQQDALELGLLEEAIPIHAVSSADYPTPARRPAYSVLDCSATYAALATEPIHWRVNLRHMLAEEKALG